MHQYLLLGMNWGIIILLPCVYAHHKLKIASPQYLYFHKNLQKILGIVHVPTPQGAWQIDYCYLKNKYILKRMSSSL